MTPTATTGTILLDLALILVAARVGGRLFARARQPAVIGEIAAGVVLGPTVLGALPGDPSEALFPADAGSVLKAIGEIGLALFMFTVGWTLDLGVLRRRGRAAAVVSVASIAPPLLLGLGLAAYLHPRHDVVDGAAVAFAPFALFVAASMAVTAFPVLARILAESGLAGTALGGLVVSAAAVDDVVGWSMLAVALAALDSQSPGDYVRVAAQSALFAVAVIVIVRPLLRRLVQTVGFAPEAIVVPAALAGAAATDAIGVHAVFGAFLVGAAMPRPVEAAAVRRVGVIVGVLAPVYFVLSGMAVDVPGLRAGDLGQLVVIVAVACAGKFLGAFAGAWAVGVEARDAAAIGVLMNTRGLIEIVLLTVGRDRGLIDDRLFTLLALMALLTTVATTPLLRAIRPLGLERGTRLEP